MSTSKLILESLNYFLNLLKHEFVSTCEDNKRRCIVSELWTGNAGIQLVQTNEFYDYPQIVNKHKPATQEHTYG